MQIFEFRYSDLPWLNQDVEQLVSGVVSRVRKTVAEAEALPEQTGVTISQEVWKTDRLVLKDAQSVQLKGSVEVKLNDRSSDGCAKFSRTGKYLSGKFVTICEIAVSEMVVLDAVI